MTERELIEQTTKARLQLRSLDNIREIRIAAPAERLFRAETALLPRGQE